jgi:hypothetical protein
MPAQAAVILHTSVAMHIADNLYLPRSSATGLLTHWNGRDLITAARCVLAAAAPAGTGRQQQQQQQN